MARKPDVNPGELLVLDLAEVYVELVEEFLEEMAPKRPWWSEQLTPDQKLWRYMEVRDTFLPWLMDCAIWMGMKTFEEMLARLDEFWFGNLFEDMVPAQLRATIPLSLLELVQANPMDASKHIRDMEKLFAARKAAANAIDAANKASPPLAPVPAEVVVPPPGPLPTDPPLQVA
jgi:hypothetical protein